MTYQVAYFLRTIISAGNYYLEWPSTGHKTTQFIDHRQEVTGMISVGSASNTPLFTEAGVRSPQTGIFQSEAFCLFLFCKWNTIVETEMDANPS